MSNAITIGSDYYRVGLGREENQEVIFLRYSSSKSLIEEREGCKEDSWRTANEAGGNPRGQAKL